MSPTDRTYWAKITFQFEGVHHYPDAKGVVEFLKHPHRHVFHCTVWIEQFHTERDIEYLQFKSWIAACFHYPGVLGAKSCETICEDIAATIRTQESYRQRRLRIEVLEDNENGALVEFER